MHCLAHSAVRGACPFNSFQGEADPSVAISASDGIGRHAASQTWFRILATNATLSCGKKRPTAIVSDDDHSVLEALKGLFEPVVSELRHMAA